MKLILTLSFSLVLHIISAFGQATIETQTTQRIASYLSNLEKVGLNGTVILGVNGEPLISQGYGYSNKESLLPNSPNTIFDIGSITKQFTATAILKLEMQGKLSTDDLLSKYFDNIPPDKEKITLHDLLRHQSGLIGNIGRDYEKITEADFLSKVFTSPLRFDPGTKFSYSNVGYSLLAMVIEKVSDLDYETYCYEHLWKPAQMEMTGYARPDFDTNLIAEGYHQDDRPWGKPTDKEWDTTSPYWHLKGNGGILSTTEDLFKWHKCLMTDIVLSKESKQKLYHPHLRTDESESFFYAYGWDVSKTSRNTTQVWHNGSNRIFYADFLRYLEEDISLIFLTNKSHPNFNNLCFEIAKIIFDSTFNPEIPVADNVENRTFTTRIIHAIERSGLDQAKKDYKKRQKTEQLLPYMMADEGFNNLDNGNPDVAMHLLEMNVSAYPTSAITLQWLGEGYMETGKKELALKYFKKSIRIYPDNRFVNDMIQRLEE